MHALKSSLNLTHKPEGLEVSSQQSGTVGI